LILHRSAVDEETRLSAALDLERVEIGVTAAFRREHDPAAVGRERGVVVEPWMIREAPRYRAGILK
jgi:hypothetical protein